MEIFSDLEFSHDSETVVTIGMFDGVHKAHQLLLSTVTNHASSLNTQSVVVTFWPHPRLVLHQDEQLLRFLSSVEEKCLIFNRFGIDKVIVLPFTLELASLTTEEFISKILVDKLKIKHLVVGYNHRFGKGRDHSFEEYSNLAQKYGFTISKVEAVLEDGVKISSTQIRNFLQNNQLEQANRQLGFFYSLSGEVVGGNQLGRQINYPTANVQLENTNKIIPCDGVYACRCHVENRLYNGMVNIGVRPTLANNAANRTIEAHLFDFNEDLYNRRITVEFVKKLREEVRFESIEHLKQQLLLDEQQARTILTKGDISLI